MKRSILVSSVTACLCLGLVAPVLAAEAPVTRTVSQPSPGKKNASAPKLAERCLSDLRSFDTQLKKDGYWLGASRYGYGYPMVGDYGYRRPTGGEPPESTTGYVNARPGYEVRTLLASATILARHGQQQSCEKVLGATRDIYKLYVADMHSGHMPMADTPSWRNQQIAAAKPVTGQNTPIRSDELLGTDVRNSQDEALGSVDDLVMSPKTGKIAYLVIARGGIFGIGEKYVPVPWDIFKVTPNANLLVLDSTKATLDGAPQVNKDQFTTPGQFGHESGKVDAYWRAHLSKIGNGGSKG